MEFGKQFIIRHATEPVGHPFEPDEECLAKHSAEYQSD
jgi:hypothetical protein